MKDLEPLRAKFFPLAREIDTVVRLWHSALVLNLRPPFNTDEVFQLTLRTAPTFFKLVQSSFSREVIAGLCRLSEPKESRIKGEVVRNLGIRTFLEDPLIAADRSFHKALTTAFAPLKAARPALVRSRNKLISHLDETVALAESDKSQRANVIRDGVNSLMASAELIATFLDEPRPDFARHAREDVQGVDALVAALRAADPGVGNTWTPAGPVPLSALRIRLPPF